MRTLLFAIVVVMMTALANTTNAQSQSDYWDKTIVESVMTHIKNNGTKIGTCKYEFTLPTQGETLILEDDYLTARVADKNIMVYLRKPVLFSQNYYKGKFEDFTQITETSEAINAINALLYKIYHERPKQPKTLFEGSDNLTELFKKKFNEMKTYPVIEGYHQKKIGNITILLKEENDAIIFSWHETRTSDMDYSFYILQFNKKRPINQGEWLDIEENGERPFSNDKQKLELLKKILQ